MSPIQVTIVIPTLNRLELAKRAFASALAQSSPVEIIVSDNGSIDGTDGYFRDLNLSENVQYFHFDQTIPVQEHGAFLRSKVRTDWVVFLSDDDELDPTFCEESLRLIDEYPDLSIVYTGAYLIYDGLSRRGKLGPRVESGASFLLSFMQGERDICMCATLFRIVDMREIPPQPANRFIGDMYFWVRIIDRDRKVGCVDKYLSYYYFYRPQIINETGRTNILQWYEESKELAQIMVATILSDPAYSGRSTMIRATANRFVAMSTILQAIWSRLRNTPRLALLSALFRMSPQLCSEAASTTAFFICGTAVAVLPRPLLEQSLLLYVRLRSRMENPTY